MGRCILQRLHSSSFGALLGNWDSQHLLKFKQKSNFSEAPALIYASPFAEKYMLKYTCSLNMFQHIYIHTYLYLTWKQRLQEERVFSFLISFLTFLRSKLHLWRKRRLVLHQHSENMCGIQLQMSSLLIAGWKIMELGIQKWWIHQINPLISWTRQLLVPTRNLQEIEAGKKRNTKHWNMDEIVVIIYGKRSSTCLYA